MIPSMFLGIIDEYQRKIFWGLKYSIGQIIMGAFFGKDPRLNRMRQSCGVNQIEETKTAQESH